MSERPDTRFYRVLDNETKVDTSLENIALSGEDDGIKGSNLWGVRIRNKNFLGHVRENAVDLVRGGKAVIGPNFYAAKCGVAEITVKGGFDGLHLIGNFGKLEFGQYSNYDRWFDLPKSTGLTFDPSATGEVEIWFAEMPKYTPPGVRVKDRRLLAYPYFLWRSIQQALFPPKK